MQTHPRPTHLAIGMFDGVHLGHRAIIASALRAARETDGQVAVYTFAPHPSHVFHPENPIPQILDAPAKESRLRALGVERVFARPFTPEFASLDAPAFLELLQNEVPALASIHVGFDFRFGRARASDVRQLRELASALGISVVATPGVEAGGTRISSTRIRQLIANGDMQEAATLLGYHYEAQGTVRPGRALGRTIGVPTLNLVWEPELAPRHGVYVVQARVGSRWFPGIANYGLRPTIETPDVACPLLETHLLADSTNVINEGFVESCQLHVEWLRFIRPEKQFPTIEALRSQIAQDIREAARR
ncbi:MAG: riboflavin biosynthesis protein RibF [Puniceicoccales bacterium]|jgi:riboflavin kinase/FMN adenylyltransferase|nr:riboflavin biosynthesis protein RibF [Puniceicoccales bacterium]